MRERRQARKLSAEIDRLLSARAVQTDAVRRPADDRYLAEELQVARRIQEMVAGLPPVPPALKGRVRRIVRSPVHVDRRTSVRRWRPAYALRTVALGAVATALVLLAVTIVLLAGPGGQRSWAQMIDVLLGQTHVELTRTFVRPTSDPLRSALTAQSPEEGAAPPVREPLRDLLAAELLIGRAPSTPRDLPEAYVLQEIAAVSYPDLPSWISQPFYIELGYGPPGAPSDLRLRQYRLLFRDFGGISSVQVDSGAVTDVERVDINGATGMLLTLPGVSQVPRGNATQPSSTVLWERDGLLHELETDSLSRADLLRVARSVR